MISAYVSVVSVERIFLEAVDGLLRLIVMAFGSNVPPEIVSDGHVDFSVTRTDAYLEIVQSLRVRFDVSIETYVLTVMPSIVGFVFSITMFAVIVPDDAISRTV